MASPSEAPLPLKWSATFQLMHPDEARARNLVGDKIVLPQSALEQLLAAAEQVNSDSSSPYRVYQGFQGSSHDQKLPHPLIFRLSNPVTGKTVFAGIQEFSAEESFVGLSPYLAETLGIDQQTILHPGNSNSPVDLTQDDDSANPSDNKFAAITYPPIVVHAQQAPKGTFVRLRPLEAGYNSEDWRALLEKQLRARYTTLTKHAVLSFANGTAKYSFLIDQLQPEGHDGICIVDTDLEVDIQPLNEEQAKKTARMLSERNSGSKGSSAGGEIDIWIAVDGQVVPGDYVNYQLPSWDHTRPLKIQVSGINSNTSIDLFVSPYSTRHRAPPRSHEHVFGNYEPAKDGTKSITIQPSNVELENADSLLIAVYGYQGPGTPSHSFAFSLRASAVSEPSSRPSSELTPNSESRGDADEQCKNCQQWIPRRAMLLHENFCRRNNVTCPQCHNVFQKSSEEWANHWHCAYDDAFGSSPVSKSKHDTIYHMKYTCEDCKQEFESLPLLAQHRTSVCPSKLILCQFCHLEVPQDGDPANPSAEMILSGLTAHELADGGRTTECHLCDKIVRLRDMQTHMKTHELNKISRSPPPICRNRRCGRTRLGVGPRGAVHYFAEPGSVDRLGFCSGCFEPLFATVHDPDGKAMRRRIERRYLTQLIAGCNKASCSNEWCKTGRKNQCLEPKGSKTSEALPMVKPLLEKIWQEDTPMFLCVEDLNQKRRSLAEMLAAENVFGLEWCIAAAEAENGDLDNMRVWLQNWAPRKV
ncbi:hypothetical protein Cpir12675_004543 [Ceratocystis pirilliformis]|uniref:Ubiquitin-protein ligase E3A N-terminal zinc-binding domain-containing protein n=1 Tax=Ceratocystis pirilliformis TaxID=259994 RepID=A0ABR3YYM7_9PEZI